MKYLVIPLFLTSAGLVLFSRQNIKEFQGYNYSSLPGYIVTVRHFIGVEGEILKWRITKDSVTIIYNCDWEGCKDTLLYQSVLDSTTSKNYLTAIRAIALDRLKGKYEDKSLRDGLYVNFEAQNVFDKPVKFSLHGVKLESVNAFYRITDSLVLANTRYKLSKYW